MSETSPLPDGGQAVATCPASREPHYNEFSVGDAPLGARIALAEKTPEGRVAKSVFNRFLFEYFENLNSGQAGWGINFIGWLEIAKGWKLLELDKFERVESLEEEVGEMPHVSPSQITPGETADQLCERIDALMLEAGAISEGFKNLRDDHPAQFKTNVAWHCLAEARSIAKRD